MRHLLSAVLALILVTAAGLAVIGCSGATRPDGEPVAERAESQAAEEAADQGPPVEPLPDEQLYEAVTAAGLAFSYGLTPADGEIEVLENMEGYGAIEWTDTEGRSVIVTRRHVEGESEEWVYVDEGATGEGVTELSPTGEQLQRYDRLAQAMLEATGAGGALTRGYAWTSQSGVGSVVYATDGVTDDPNMHVSFGEGEVLQRVDFTIR